MAKIDTSWYISKSSDTQTPKTIQLLFLHEHGLFSVNTETKFFMISPSTFREESKNAFLKKTKIECFRNALLFNITTVLRNTEVFQN